MMKNIFLLNRIFEGVTEPVNLRTFFIVEVVSL